MICPKSFLFVCLAALVVIVVVVVSGMTSRTALGLGAVDVDLKVELRTCYCCGFLEV